MSQIAVYTLDQFVADLRATFANGELLPAKATSVAAVLQRLLGLGGWVQRRLDAGGYDALGGSVYTDADYGYPGPGFHITCGADTLSQYRPPHDHGAGWVVYGVYKGAIEQTRYGWDYSAGNLAPQFVPRTSFVQKAGEVAYFLPGEAHTTRNVAGERTIVVRVESQNLSRVVRHGYDLPTNAAALMKSN